MAPSVHPISGEIEGELALVEREVGHLSIVLERIGHNELPPAGSQAAWEVSSLCASAAEKIYTGCERVLAKIAAEIDRERVDKDDGWHRALLDRMKLPFGNRDAVLTPDTYDLLNRVRGFRHRERNTYGVDLDTPLVLEKARDVIQAYGRLANNVRRFLAEQPGGD